MHSHKERVQNLSKEEQLIKLCEDAGFVKTVAPAQFFITRDAGEFSEFDGHVGCRDCTLPRDEESSTPKRWIRENTKISPVLEVTTNYHHGKPGIEIGIASLSGDESHSWVRIFSDLNKFETDLTEKIRILGDDEVDSTSTGRPVAQETRIVKYSQTEADKPAARRRQSRLHLLSLHPLRQVYQSMKEIGLILNPTDVALDIGKQPTMTAMRVFASCCTYLDMVNVGYITVDLTGSQCKACALVRFELRGLRC